MPAWSTLLSVDDSFYFSLYNVYNIDAMLATQDVPPHVRSAR